MEVTIRDVKHFPYRTALARDTVAELPRDLMYAWEKRLADFCGVQVDNHTGYLVSTSYKDTFYMFSDMKMYVATGYTEKKW